MRLRTLGFLLRHDFESFTNDNLHRIAISNLSDGERSLRRWWEKKYKTPHKEYEDHTVEELLVQMFEDYYDQNPAEIQRFVLRSNVEEWDGRMSKEHDERMKKRFGNTAVLKKYQDFKPITEEEEQRILDSLGRNLPGSKFVRDLGGGEKSVRQTDEFEDEFLGVE